MFITRKQNCSPPKDLSYMSIEMFSLQVQAVLDGCYQKEVSMEYSPSVLKGEPQTSSHLMLGYAVPLDVMDPETGSCQLGNLMLFKGFFCLIHPHSLALIFTHDSRLLSPICSNEL